MLREGLDPSQTPCENGNPMPLLFRRLHAKFDQIDATIERNTRAFERNEAAFERHEHAFERHGQAFEQAFEDLRIAMREDRVLAERRTQAFEQTLGRLVERLDDMGVEIRANTTQLKALTDATFKMLDRFGEGPMPAS